MKETFEDVDHEEDEKLFVEIIDLSKDLTKPIGFVFYYKSQNVSDLRAMITKQQVLPKTTIFDFYDEE